ncbi:MAG: hypothetical protein U0Q22_05915 [Acidimicrobiales bacterium]
MHPIERLRYVARSTGAPQETLIVESARALATFHDDPVGLVTACRRVVSRQIAAGGLWWLCSRMLCAAEPLDEARAVVEAVEDDTTPRSLALALDPEATVAVLGWPSGVAEALIKRGSGETLVVDCLNEGSALVRYLDGHGIDAVDVPLGGLGAAVATADVLVLEAGAASVEAALSVTGSLAAAAVARHAGVPVWLVVGVGRALPTRVWDALVSRWDVSDEPWEADEEIVPLSLVDVVIGPDGPLDAAAVASLVDCPIAPELFKADIT